MKIHEFLISQDACKDAKEWAEGQTWPEIYAACHRGDWLLWLFARTNPELVRERVLAACHCANTVRGLMKDPRSVAAVDAAIAFGVGKIDKQELKDAAGAAGDAGAAGAAGAAGDAAWAAWAAWAAGDAAWAAGAAWAAWAAAWAAGDANRQQTADICRRLLPIEIWNIEI